jgi:hypothetical protein
MRIRIPPKKVREKFLLTYELHGCQKAVDFLTKYYGARRMKIVLDGKRVGKNKANGWIACYSKNKAHFTKRGLNRRTVLHELYHHLLYVKGLGMSQKKEETAANSYARDLLRKLLW